VSSATHTRARARARTHTHTRHNVPLDYRRVKATCRPKPRGLPVRMCSATYERVHHVRARARTHTRLTQSYSEVHTSHRFSTFQITVMSRTAAAGTA
jgi:hypothetical protein